MATVCSKWPRAIIDRYERSNVVVEGPDVRPCRCFTMASMAMVIPPHQGSGPRLGFAEVGKPAAPVETGPDPVSHQLAQRH